MVFCVKCGFEITEESAKFCPKCGTNVFQHSKTDSKVNSVSAKPITSPSKRSNKKIIMISVILSLIAVFIIVPFITTSIGNFGDGYHLRERQDKIASCNGNVYTDVNGNFCCFYEAEYIIWNSVNQKICPFG